MDKVRTYGNNGHIATASIVDSPVDYVVAVYYRYTNTVAITVFFSGYVFSVRDEEHNLACAFNARDQKEIFGLLDEILEESYKVVSALVPPMFQ